MTGPGGASEPLPAGFRIVLDADTRQLDDTLLFGGSPARIMRLSAAGARAYADLRAGPVRSAACGTLARRLTDAGLAHPGPPGQVRRPDVTVIIPVRDRAALLARALDALGGHYPVVVVDDGSRAPNAVAEVAAARGATLLPQANAGPGPARNTALAGVTSEFVAFLDSDCEPGPGWIESLAEHFADPLVGAVAPRITARPADAAAGPRAAADGGLDLGDRAARVVPASRVSYVPTAALLARRAALADVSRDGVVFDPALRYGEDVDLIWRLHEAGWRVRYDPSVLVPHTEPGSRAGLLARRFRYGTSAGPLAVRHPEAMAPLALQPWPAVAVGGLLARKPAIAAAGFATAVLTMSATLRRAGVPARGLLPATVTSTRQTWLGVGRYLTQFAAPLLIAGIARPGGGSAARRWGRRTAAASLLLGPPLTAWAGRRPGIGPVPFALGHIADDVCYGAGVWAGAISAGTTVPLRPVLVRRPVRIEPRPGPRQARARTADRAPGRMEHGL